MKILRVISSVNPAAGSPINGLINSTREWIKNGYCVEVLSLDDHSSPWLKNFEFPLVSFKSSLGVFWKSLGSIGYIFKHWVVLIRLVRIQR